MTASKIRLLYCCFFLLFPIAEASIRAPRARYTTTLVRGITSRLTPDLGRVFYSIDKCFETGRGRLCRDGAVAKPTILKSVPKITRNGSRRSRNGQPALEKERFSGR